MPICALCKQPVSALRESHLIPAGFYRQMTRSSGGYTSATKEAAGNTSQQVKELLLGDCCEQRLEQNGEGWVLKNYSKDGKFPILNNLVKVHPILTKGDTKYFNLASNADIDIEKIVYFAASVFWRAGAHSWKFPTASPYSIQLGPYLESLRLFLLGQSGFPANASLGIFVSPNPLHDGVIFPQRAHRTGDHFMRHGFFVPGMTFVLCTGKTIPSGVTDECAARTKTLMLGTVGENLARQLRAGLAQPQSKFS